MDRITPHAGTKPVDSQRQTIIGMNYTWSGLKDWLYVVPVARCILHAYNQRISLVVSFFVFPAFYKTTNE